MSSDNAIALIRNNKYWLQLATELGVTLSSGLSFVSRPSDDQFCFQPALFSQKPEKLSFFTRPNSQGTAFCSASATAAAVLSEKLERPRLKTSHEAESGTIIMIPAESQPTASSGINALVLTLFTLSRCYIKLMTSQRIPPTYKRTAGSLKAREYPFNAALLVLPAKTAYPSCQHYCCRSHSSSYQQLLAMNTPAYTAYLALHTKPI